ncbi:DUF2637 domain-containing protein [Streptomyces stelliscabiei]|uniref:DUF2637 domain-containing protein n=1 Tax=Streptomyces stelliscabiei TaxID=146820 RepID=UPI002FEF9198
MPSPTPKTPAATRSGRTIRAGIALLAVVAFALSYDALRQMAVAGHVRGLLTYLFPLVIDGFIAIGIVALLILRTAPRGSRFYVWMLVGVATGTSIGANVVHAVGLNEGTRLHLNNATVGALSAIAPLALAGAVHLYLVMNRYLAAGGAMAETSPIPPPAKSATPGDDRPIRQEQTDDDTTAPSARATNSAFYPAPRPRPLPAHPLETLHARPAPRTPHCPAGDGHHLSPKRHSKLSGKDSLPGSRPGGCGGIRRWGARGGRPRGADRDRGYRVVVERAAAVRATSPSA